MPNLFIYKGWSKHMGSTLIATDAGCSLESVEAIEQVREILGESNVNYTEESSKEDSKWLYQLLSKYLQIKYVRIVKEKPRKAILIKKRRYFDAYMAKRMMPDRSGQCAMILLHPRKTLR